MSLIRIIEHPTSEVLPSQQERGVVEDLSVNLDDNGYQVQIVRTLWSRNKRRSDQRHQVIKQDVLIGLTAHEAAELISMLAATLVHAKNSFIRPEGD